MTDLRQAAQQALEALVAAYQGKDKTGQVTEAITALRAALAEPEQKVWCDCGDSIEPDSGAKCGNCVAGDSAEPEQEPQTTHWEGCEAVHPECVAPAAMRSSGGD